MTRIDKQLKPLAELESIQILSPPLRACLEEAVSTYTRSTWHVTHARDMDEFASHPSALASDGSFAVFAKYSQQPDAAEQFEAELAGLEYLADTAKVMIPTPIGIFPAENGAFFITAALDEIERGPQQWQQIGQTLARIHRVKSASCGFHRSNYFGPLHQDNTPTPEWAAFYAERRLRPHLRMAVDAGNIPSGVAAQVESLIKHLPELSGPEVPPTLLHGDAQQNNFISTPQGAYVIDPAVHYGSPEYDLALVGYWQPAPQTIFEGYQDELPITPGFSERCEFRRISGYLAAVALEGADYLSLLTNALKGYL